MVLWIHADLYEMLQVVKASVNYEVSSLQFV